jgi:uncharacterized protein YecE (DUF72 family)
MVHVGISGWTYPKWRGVFYPEGLVHRKELHYASRELSSIEINGTHYALQKPKSFAKWRDEVPEDFVFSVKATRFITHIRRLKDCEEPLANFFASGLLVLGPKLGPILWQLPPSFRYDEERLEDFLKLLPGNSEDAERLARKATLASDRIWTRAQEGSRFRHCMEVRHDSFMVPEFFAQLRRYRVAFVLADTAGKWPYAEDVTSDFMYLRLHGDSELYVSGYTEEAIQYWAARIRQWRQGRQPGDARLVTPRAKPAKGGRDVFVYFDNDAKVKAPRDAKRLIEALR